MHCASRVSAPVRCAFGSLPASNARSLRLHASPVAEAVNSRTAYDEFEQLAQHAGATVLTAVGPTPLGRGLVATHNVAPRDPAVSVPVHNALVIADDPINGISIFSDRQHRKWQEAHGTLPGQLLEFLQGVLERKKQRNQQHDCIIARLLNTVRVITTHRPCALQGKTAGTSVWLLGCCT